MFAVSADNSTCVNRTLQWRWLETQKFSDASVIDLQKKETARASMRKMVKHLLKKFKYPPVASFVYFLCFFRERSCQDQCIGNRDCNQGTEMQ